MSVIAPTLATVCSDVGAAGGKVSTGATHTSEVAVLSITVSSTFSALPTVQQRTLKRRLVPIGLLRFHVLRYDRRERLLRERVCDVREGALVEPLSFRRVHVFRGLVGLGRRVRIARRFDFDACHLRPELENL